MATQSSFKENTLVSVQNVQQLINPPVMIAEFHDNATEYVVLTTKMPVATNTTYQEGLDAIAALNEAGNYATLGTAIPIDTSDLNKERNNFATLFARNAVNVGLQSNYTEIFAGINSMNPEEVMVLTTQGGGISASGGSVETQKADTYPIWVLKK